MKEVKFYKLFGLLDEKKKKYIYIYIYINKIFVVWMQYLSYCM